MSIQTLFESEKLALFELEGEHRDDIWIGFGSIGGDYLALEPYFKKSAQHVLFVVSKLTDFYQNPEIWEVLRIVRARTSGTKGRIVLFGSSLGGFGALAFSGILDATHVIAAAPYASIDPAIVGDFDARSVRFGSTLHFEVPDSRTVLSATAQISILYDGLHRIDRKHVDLLREFPNVKAYSFPMSGHGCFHTLNKSGILQPMLPFLIDKRDNTDRYIISIMQKYRHAVRKTPDYYFAAGEWYFERRQFVRAVPWHFRTLSMNPYFGPAFGLLLESLSQIAQSGTDNTFDFIKFGALMLESGRLVQADQIVRRALALLPRSAPLLHLAGTIELKNSHFEQSFNLYKEAVALHPEIYQWYINTAHAALLSGARETAVEYIRLAKERFGNEPEIIAFDAGL